MTGQTSVTNSRITCGMLTYGLNNLWIVKNNSDFEERGFEVVSTR